MSLTKPSCKGGGSFISGSASGWETGASYSLDGYVTVDVVLGTSTDESAPPRVFYASTCGTTGRTGPTEDACNAAYTAGSKKQFLGLTSVGYQRFKVWPCRVVLRLCSHHVLPLLPAVDSHNRPVENHRIWCCWR